MSADITQRAVLTISQRSSPSDLAHAAAECRRTCTRAPCTRCRARGAVPVRRATVRSAAPEHCRVSADRSLGDESANDLSRSHTGSITQAPSHSIVTITQALSHRHHHTVLSPSHRHHHTGTVTHSIVTITQAPSHRHHHAVLRCKHPAADFADRRLVVLRISPTPATGRHICRYGHEKPRGFRVRICPYLSVCVRICPYLFMVLRRVVEARRRRARRRAPRRLPPPTRAWRHGSRTRAPYPSLTRVGHPNSGADTPSCALRMVARLRALVSLCAGLEPDSGSLWCDETS